MLSPALLARVEEKLRGTSIDLSLYVKHLIQIDLHRKIVSRRIRAQAKTAPSSQRFPIE